MDENKLKLNEEVKFEPVDTAEIIENKSELEESKDEEEKHKSEQNEDVSSTDNNHFHNSYVWENITSDFFESIKELSLGELMHHEIFGLFEAMSAIEMMDPKMDAGMCCNKDTPPPLNFQMAVKEGVLKLENLEFSELIGIFDGIFSCVVSWLEGHSMAQTVFTCLYLHEPLAINDKYLKAFCVGIHKLIDSICAYIMGSTIFEEEDFQPSKYGFGVLPVLTDQKCMESLKSAEEDLIKKLKANDICSEEMHGVINRLKFLRFLLRSLVTLRAYNSSGQCNPRTEKDINESVRLLNCASDLIPFIKKTIEKGTQPEDKSDEPNPMGFSPHVNQRLLPSTFPRYIKIKDRPSSIAFLEDLVQRIKLACKVIHCNNYHSALNFFMEFSKKSGPCLLSRSILQCLYIPAHNAVFGIYDITDVLKESAKAFIAPPVLMSRNPLYNNQQARECVDSFFYYSMHMPAFITFLTICGFNRARQRDKLAKLLEEFANLQDEAERVDAYLHSLAIQSVAPRQHLACFGTWVLYHCLRAMGLFLLSGLELELYSVHEYLYIFWYLYEFLFGWIVSALTRADSFLTEQEYLNDEKPSSSKQRKPKINKKKKIKPYCREIMFNQAMQNMSGGYYKGLAGFTKEERIPQPLSVFDNEKVRFDHRFAPFATLTTPPPVPYIEFKKMRSHLLKSASSDLYLAAAKHFHQARSILEAIPNPDPEMNDILRIAKINFVVMNVMASGHKKDSTKPPEFDFSGHRYFPIIKQP